MNARKVEKRCKECGGWPSLRGQESSAHEACDCVYPRCFDCNKECDPGDRIPWGQGVAHFECATRQALTVLKARKDGGTKVLVMSLRRGPAFTKRRT